MINASKQTGLLILEPGHNGGLAGAQSPEDQMEAVQSNGREGTQEGAEITLLRVHVQVLTEKVSSELGYMNNRCNQLGEALNKFSASAAAQDFSFHKSMKDMMDQFAEKNQRLSSGHIP